MRHLALSAAIVAGLAQPGMAEEDHVVLPGPVSDDDFYRAVACAAPPGRPCYGPIVRWSRADAADLTLSIKRMDAGFNAPQTARAAVADAIDQINAADAALSLRMVAPGSDAHITLHFTDLPSGGTISGIGLTNIDGATVYDAYYRVYWDERKALTRAIVVFSRDVRPSELPSVILEEILQSLGLLKDVLHPWYETRSVFSEIGNHVSILAGQDMMALRRHYPKQ